ncbi:DUF488 domain-containing protein [bacterium]|nr:DUF488 domain-containing protein [candidate division CSSED10-310 bacterium]
MTADPSPGTPAADNQAESTCGTVYTIGHSNLEPYQLVRLLVLNMIEMVIDVRSIPYSRSVPQFNRETLEKLLTDSGMEYRFGGKHLGAYPDGIKSAGREKADWYALSQRPEFRQGIQRVLELAKSKRIALLCAEENPVRCHRHHLIAPALIETGLRVVHIRRDGSLEDLERDPQKKLF